MVSTKMQQTALVAREARLALLELRNLVDSAEQSIRTAERDAVGLAIGKTHHGDPLGALRVAAEALRSPSFEAAVSQARAKAEDAFLACGTS
jgi:hypothetical protein